MSHTVQSVEVWAGDLRNRPGMLARVLEALSAAGARLELVVARRVTENTSRVFVAPLKGKAQKKAAADVGLSPARGMNTLRLEAPDKAGLGARLTRAIADADINIRGLTAAAMRAKLVLYVAFKTAAEAKAAAVRLRKALRTK